MRVHIVGLPHTSFDDVVYSHCAFTSKAVRWTRILKSIGIEPVVYWAGDGTAEDVEFHSLLGSGPRDAMFGEYDASKLPTVDWNGFQPHWQGFNLRAIIEITKRIRPGDIVAILAGHAANDVVTQFQNMGYHVIEPAVGYEGLGTGTYAAFESFAWMHYVYGLHRFTEGRSFDTVIPQFLDPTQFELGTDQGYLLYMGRMYTRKGISVASEIATEAGLPIKFAGGGVERAEPGLIVCTDGTELKGNVEYVGAVGPAARKRLLANATALICPTIYIEPFGTVHAEAMMSGVPVLTPNYGVFTETVVNGKDGYRYTNMRTALEGLGKMSSINRRALRKRAIERFSMKSVEPAWAAWFDQLATLSDKGWYSK